MKMCTGRVLAVLYGKGCESGRDNEPGKLLSCVCHLLAI